MEIYLPIAEMSVHWLVILGLGGAVGFLSGLLGVGGGFLLTPLLIFVGIPAPVAVATTASHLTAASSSGALAQWRNRAVDLKMAAVMTLGGVLGVFVGVWIFAALRRSGQMDFAVSASYVLLLGTIGALMLRESLRAMSLKRDSLAGPRSRPAKHLWIHGLPFKERFPVSRLYISVIPPVVIGFTVGALSAVLGVGGGFIIVPAMIYLLRMPTNVVMGTSLAQIIVVTALTTVLQAVDNHAVDLVLAFLLVVGGAIGAQLGVRAASRLRGEHLRLLLALAVLAVAGKLLADLVSAPEDLYSVASSRA
ncbi:MAG TPA: sulfite exporter TauE/SafE family protein [Rhizomicrobium sp.]|nr:sulfite exporter TauE/SafE family protein [Rhizomicrobium sp.]